MVVCFVAQDDVITRTTLALFDNNAIGNRVATKDVVNKGNNAATSWRVIKRCCHQVDACITGTIIFNGIPATGIPDRFVIYARIIVVAEFVNGIALRVWVDDAIAILQRRDIECPERA